MAEKQTAQYRPEVFDVPDLQRAKEIILTPLDHVTAEQRWEIETPRMTALLGEALRIQPGHLILDYGCGVGRLAKPLIEKHTCAVIGTDISLSMMQLAPDYTRRTTFSIVHPHMLDVLNTRGPLFDSAYSVFVIQHVPNPQEDIRRISGALKPGAPFCVVNARWRCVPTDIGWVNDEIDIIALLRENFSEVNVIDLPVELTALPIEPHFYARCVK